MLALFNTYEGSKRFLKFSALSTNYFPWLEAPTLSQTYVGENPLRLVAALLL